MFFKLFKSNTWHEGDTPPKGYYICALCTSDYSMFNVPGDGKELPCCPCCGNDEWMQI